MDGAKIFVSQSWNRSTEVLCDFPKVTLVLGGSGQKQRLVTLGLFLSVVLASSGLEISMCSQPSSSVIQDCKLLRKGSLPPSSVRFANPSWYLTHTKYAVNVCYTDDRKHWLFGLCCYRRVLLRCLAAENDCNASPRFSAAKPGGVVSTPQVCLFSCRSQFTAAFMGNERRQGKAHPVKETKAGLRGCSASNEPAPSAAFRKLMSQKG